VNLIPFNDWEGSKFARPPLPRIVAFQGYLLEQGIIATVRWSKAISRAIRPPLPVAVLLAVASLALVLPIEKLAEATSLASLATFALVNLSLLRIRSRRIHSTFPHVRVPIWVPAMGVLTCLVMIASSFLL
jgi:amino acid transporter